MFFYILLMCVTLSLDSAFAGLSYGIGKIKVPFLTKLSVSLMSGMYSVLALLAGNVLSSIIPESMQRYIGCIALVILGAFMLYSGWKKSKKTEDPPSKSSKILKKEKRFEWFIKSLGVTIEIIKTPAVSDQDHSGVIDLKESILLGLALSIDSLSVGIACSLSGMSSWMIPLFIALFQYIFLSCGIFLGEKFCKKIHNPAAGNLASGLLLMILGILRIF